jgi:predicted NAD/FAD-binding protein
MKLKIAVIGSGIAGLGSSLLLSSEHEVHLFEHEPRLGGHAHTSDIKVGNDSVAVDTGFLVYNELTYPHLIGMFDYLGVETINSDMSLSIRVPSRNLEWAGDNMNTIFAQRKNLLSPRFYRLLLDILKFHKQAESNCELSRINRWTVADLLHEMKFTKELAEWYILPMLAAIWSTPEQKMFDFPAETFLTFFINHKLLQVNDRPQWKTVKGGSRQYVKKIADRLSHIHLGEGVLSVEKTENNKLKLSTAKGEYLFDKVVFATAPAVTRKILKTQNEKLQKFLNSFQVVPNKAVLHRDESLMPVSKKCWASWCVQANLKSEYSNNVALTYYLNRLQPLSTQKDIFLSLNPAVEAKEVVFKVDYTHPMFDQKAIDAQIELPGLQGIDGVFHAGAWTRYGFHEDGLLSAVNVAKCFSIEVPWKVGTAGGEMKHRQTSQPVTADLMV